MAFYTIITHFPIDTQMQDLPKFFNRSYKAMWLLALKYSLTLTVRKGVFFSYFFLIYSDEILLFQSL